MRGRHRTHGGFTLVELLTATALSSVLAAGLLITLMSVQRNYKACDHYAERQTEQLRIMDYMALDLRRALTVTVQNGELRMTIPDYYQVDGLGNQSPRNPTISQGQVDYGNAGTPVAISYRKQGASIIRTVDGVQAELASDVKDMSVAFQDLGQVIQVSVTFIPTFQLSGSTAVSEAATVATARVLLRNKRRN